VCLDVSQASTSICVVTSSGNLLFETAMPTDAGSIAVALKPYRRMLAAVGHETELWTPFLHREIVAPETPSHLS
jgi:hypothetical protein